MSANVTVTANQWWNDIPRPRRLLAMLCLLVSKEEHPSFHWNGETGDVLVLNPDGTRNYEMVPPPLVDFREVLRDLKENWSLYEKREIQFEIPLKSAALKTRIRLEQRELFPHLYVEVTDCGSDAERDEALDSWFNDHLPFNEGKSRRVTIRGKVLDHNDEPVSGVRLADRKSNWSESMMDKVKPGGLASQVIFSDENGEYELRVELTPGIPDLDEIVVVYKSPSINQWLRAEFDPADIEASPNDVTLRLQEPGSLSVFWDFSVSDFADCEHLQIGVFRDGFYRVSDIDSKGELKLSGLVPGVYQIGIGMTNTRQQLVHQAVEVNGGATVELKLEPNNHLERKLHLKLSGLPTTRDKLAEDIELLMEIYPDLQSPWGQRGLSWSRKLSAMDLDKDGVYEANFDVSSLWISGVRIWFYHNANTVCSGEWKESTSTCIHRHYDASQKVESATEWEFEDGTKLELRVDDSCGESAPNSSPEEESRELKRWWIQQSRQRRIFSRLLVTAIRQGLSLAYWEQSAGTFSGYRKDDNATALLQRLGDSRFDVVLRELEKEGLSLSEPLALEIPTGEISTEKESIVVDVSLTQQSGERSPMMKLSWRTVTDPTALAALKTLVASLAEDWEYKAVRGRVLDHHGQPVSDAVVFDAEETRRYTFIMPEGREPVCGIGPRTDEDGNFEMQIIQRDEDNRNEQEGIVLAVQTEQLKGGHLKLEGPLGSADIEGIEIQLPQPTELVVNYDIAGVDDVVAPLKLYLESVEGDYWETVTIESTGETRFPNLAPGLWVVSIHQFANDLARRVVELTGAGSEAVSFTSAEKASMQCEVVCSSKPNKNTTVDVRLESKNRSPYESFREDEDANFEWVEQVEIESDQFEEHDGQWRFAFPIRNLVGGLYELEVSVDRPEKENDNVWSEFRRQSKRKEVIIHGDTPKLDPVELEWKLDQHQTIRLTVASH